MALHDTGSYFHLKESGISLQEVFNSNNKDSQGYSRAKLKQQKKCYVHSRSTKGDIYLAF